MVPFFLILFFVNCFCKSVFVFIEMFELTQLFPEAYKYCLGDGALRPFCCV